MKKTNKKGGLYEVLILIEIIIIVVFIVSLVILNKKLNDSKKELKNKQTDILNIDEVNECTNLDSCESYKCLCDIILSHDYYCQKYENYCVNDVCSEITKEFNGVNFMDEEQAWNNNRYSGCIFVYDKTVEIIGIKIDDITEETLVCLSDYRNSKNVSDDFIYDYEYRNGKWLNEEYMRLEC